MKILFLTPPLKAWDSHGHHLAPNQMHAQLAAYVRVKDLGVPFVIDSRASELDWDGMMKRVNEIQPDMVFVGELLHSTCGAAVIAYFNDGLKMIKEAMPNVLTVAGGLWYSGDWERQMRLNPTIDYIMLGEAELTLEDLITNLKTKEKDENTIPGLVSRQGDTTAVVGPHRDLIPDLNKLPMPAYDLFPMTKYVGHTYWKPFAE
ncbi:MAG: cobalamin-dependent protein, partial [Candidatus Omnitrophica bacterium]|nr:cobalamin-dependent protein [Candidatus Omnitrophota bacterium]